MKEDFYKKVEKIFYNYKNIDSKIEEILNKSSNKTDINSYIKTNYKTCREELEVINKLDNEEIKRLLKEKYVVDRTLEKYENDYRADIIKRRYFNGEKNYVIYDSMGLWKTQYSYIVKEIIGYATLVAIKLDLINF